MCVCSLSGMDLFEEALRRWEEALTFRSRQAEDDASCASIKTGAGDTIAEQSMEVRNGLQAGVRKWQIVAIEGCTVSATVV